METRGRCLHRWTHLCRLRQRNDERVRHAGVEQYPIVAKSLRPGIARDLCGRALLHVAHGGELDVGQVCGDGRVALTHKAEAEHCYPDSICHLDSLRM
jgi:hypothetical protein